ncbi:MAG: hypothetical protein ACXVA2_21455 [Mucilaginibacter sp.]
MPNSKVEQWLSNHPNASSNYQELVRLVKSGTRVECCAELGDKSTPVYAEYKKTGFGEIFSIVDTGNEDDVLMFSCVADFIEFCESKDIIFGKQDFLESTRKMLEIAKNAAQFKGISVQLNTPQEVEVLLALMDRDSALSSVR